MDTNDETSFRLQVDRQAVSTVFKKEIKELGFDAKNFPTESAFVFVNN
jgi:HJR/Mrr/RecB family endonuclease